MDMRWNNDEGYEMDLGHPIVLSYAHHHDALLPLNKKTATPCLHSAMYVG
jgi:hypothetical protein